MRIWFPFRGRLVVFFSWRNWPPVFVRRGHLLLKRDTWPSRLFARVWRRRLIDGFTGEPCRVVRVTGWRSCLLDTPSGDRRRVTFLLFRGRL